MTGRDLIVYILSNRLEDTKIDENSPIRIENNYLNVEETAALFKVGTGTVKAWSKMGILKDVSTVNGMIYISKDDIIRMLAAKS